MSRSRAFVGGVGLGWVRAGVISLTNLWLIPFVLSHLGTRDYGLWLIGLQFTSYLLLLDLGIVGVLPREAAYASGRAAEEGAAPLASLLGETAWILLFQMPVVVLAAIGLWLWIPDEWSALRDPLALVLVAFVVLFPGRAVKGALLGLQDIPFLESAQTWSFFVYVATLVWLIEQGHGIGALALAWIAQQGALTLACCLRLVLRHRAVLPRRLPPLDRASIGRRLRQGFWVSLGQVAGVLLAGTDVFIIGKALGPEAVVPYACTAKLLLILAQQPQLLVEQSVPALSQLRVADERRFPDVAGSLLLAVSILSGAIALATLAANHGFVAWWIGPEQWGGDRLNALLVASVVVRHASSTLASALFCFGHERRTSITLLVDGAASVAVSVVLVRAIGPIGAPIGILCGSLIVGIPANVLGLARETGRPASAFLAPLAPWAWRAALLLGGALLLGKRFVPAGLAQVAATGAVAGLVYAGLMLPVAMRSSLGPYIRERIASFRAKTPPVVPVSGEKT